MSRERKTMQATERGNGPVVCQGIRLASVLSKAFDRYVSGSASEPLDWLVCHTSDT